MTVTSDYQAPECIKAAERATPKRVLFLWERAGRSVWGAAMAGRAAVGCGAGTAVLYLCGGVAFFYGACFIRMTRGDVTVCRLWALAFFSGHFATLLRAARRQ